MVVSIIYISSFFPSQSEPYRGHYVLKQAKILSEKLKQNLIVVKPEPSKDISFKKKPSFHLTNYNNISMAVIKFYNPFGLVSLTKNTRENYKILEEKLLKVFENEKPELIVTNDYRMTIVLGNLLAKACKARHINIVHGEDSTWIGKNNLQSRSIRKELIKCDVVFSVSEKIHNYLKKRFDYSNSIINHNGLPLELIKKYSNKNINKNQKLTVVSVGNLSHNKGFDLVIKALKEVNRPYTYYIVGEGPQKNNLEKKVLKYELNNHVEFLGSIDNESVYNLLERSHFFVLPSRNEAFGIVYLEAMLTKNICIGRKGQGCEDFIISKKNGYLIETSKEITQLLNTFNFDEEFSQIINNAHESARKFTWDKNVENLIKHLEDK